MFNYLLNNFLLICFNFGNVQIDAYKILKNKTIAHGINFTAYVVFAMMLFIFVVKPAFSWSEFPFLDFLNYLSAAFFNRQISFDIPLNLERGLKWYYVSTDRPPKAWLDRQEVRLFGYNGKLVTFVYASLWLVCSLIKNFLL